MESKKSIVDKETAINYLKQCRGDEFLDVLHQVFKVRPEDKDEDENQFVTQQRLVLGMAFRENLTEDADTVEWSQWQIAGIGYQNPEHYPRDFGGEPFLQWGECPNCHIRVYSHVKAALCPVCDSPVYLT